MARESIRFCAKCGHAVEELEVYGRMRPVCPACGRIHFFDPKVAVAVFVQKDGKVLLIQRANTPEKGKWALPAGFVDADEEPHFAAARECLEETGLQIRVTGLLDVFSRGDQTEGADILIVYSADVVDGTPTAADDAELVAFFRPDDLPELAFPSTRILIDRWCHSLER